MEKILEKYFLEEVNEVIDKHIKYHEEFLSNEVKSLALLDSLLCGDYPINEKSRSEIDSHVSAIASLMMLKKELNGEVEY